MQEKSDHILIEEYLKGDKNSFGILYDKYSAELYSYIRGMAGYTDAEDILHDVFIQVAESLDSYVEKGKFKSWLYTVARSKTLDSLRKKKSRKEKYLNHEAGETIAGKNPHPHEKESLNEMKKILDEAINKLPEIQREVFIMRQDAELSFREISEALGIPVNTALSHMHRATEALRDSLRKLDISPV